MATLRWSVVKPLVTEVAPRRALEIGCGQGGFGARIASRAQYLGVEPDAASCDVAKQRIEPLGGTVVQGFAEDVVTSRDFDLVCAFEVCEHIEDDVAALSSWRDFVVPGGALIVSVPAWPHRFTQMDEMVGHFRRYTPDDLTATLTKAGWEQPRTVLYGWPLGYALEYVRVRVARRRGYANETGEANMADRSAASGRLFQPSQAAGRAVAVGVAPFAAVQRTRPKTGVGLVALARRA
jgi:SAM-dependent methyltransferase